MIKNFQSTFEQYVNEVDNFNINPDLNKYENIEELYLHFDNNGFYEKRKYK